jgi:hypothetical protein
LRHLSRLGERPDDGKQTARAYKQRGDAHEKDAERPRGHVLLGNEIVLGALVFAAGAYLTREARKLINEGREGLASVVAMLFGPICLIGGSFLLLIGLRFSVFG